MKFKNKGVKRITYDINSAVNLSLDFKNTKMKKVASINQKLKRSNSIDSEVMNLKKWFFNSREDRMLQPWLKFQKTKSLI